MQQDIIKLCADSLRSFTLEKYGIKLKAAHAHELTTTFFGYPSKNAMLADTTCTLDKLNQAKIIVLDPEAFVDQRRKELDGLPPGLPDSPILGGVISSTILSNMQSASAFPPFASFISLARFMAEDRGLIESGQLYGVPRHHILDVKYSLEGVLVTIKHAFKADDGKMHVDALTKLELPRVAGRIGYGLVSISEDRAGSVREVLAPKAA